MREPGNLPSDPEAAVSDRYSRGAAAVEQNLCCPASYAPELLEALPQEVVERDYGCGNPAGYLHAGETVLDLGSGSGKTCFIAGQVVGPSGRVIGIDINEDMLEVARRNAPEVARRLGYANVEFRRGRIQDLALDLDKLEAWLRENPVETSAGLARLESVMARLRATEPMVPDGSVDVVISSCVLNLVRPEGKQNLFSEIFRALRRGGRAVISDIVSDEDVPEHLQADPELWSGCISGAFREDLFLEAFERAGFYGIRLLERRQDPWRTIEGLEFRSVTVEAYKGKEGPCWDQKHAVIYGGPFRQVEDDDGHVLRRGAHTAVCAKTFGIYSQEPYRSHFELIPPRVLVPLEEAPPFPCSRGALTRHPKETKGEDYRVTTEARACGPGDGNCCG